MSHSQNRVGCFWDYGTLHTPQTPMSDANNSVPASPRLHTATHKPNGCEPYSPENLPANQSGNSAIGYVAAFQEIAKRQGIVTMFKAYLQINQALSKKARQEYQSMGVTLVDCSHAGKKEVADKIMIG